MPGRKRGSVPVEVLRDAVSQKAEKTSVRQVAKAIGISTTGLYMFIQHGIPQNRTYRKLLIWYVREHQKRTRELDGETVRAMLEALTLHLPPRKRREIQRQILELLGDGVPVPKDMKESRKHR